MRPCKVSTVCGKQVVVSFKDLSQSVFFSSFLNQLDVYLSTGELRFKIGSSTNAKPGVTDAMVERGADGILSPRRGPPSEYWAVPGQVQRMSVST